AAWAATLPLRADAAARDANVAGTEAESVTEIRRAAALAPWESRYPARLGALAMRGDDHAAAVDAYREALDREPRGLAHTINLGRAAALAGQEDLADATYARLLELDPHTPEILVEVAAYHLEQGRTDRAEALLGEAVALRDDEARWWVALGEAREAQGDTDGAADAFTRALELDPDAEFAPDAEGAATNGE
ncbi:MAG: tetratricopeptide repeat protein, partial [Egibacteraceae bacterium]